MTDVRLSFGGVVRWGNFRNHFRVEDVYRIYHEPVFINVKAVPSNYKGILMRKGWGGKDYKVLFYEFN